MLLIRIKNSYLVSSPLGACRGRDDVPGRRSEACGCVPTRRGIVTFSVQAVDSAGNRSPASSVTLTNQAC
jgi:hypothetical protein